MPISPNQPLKLLYLMKILLDKTDENHALTIKELSDELAAYGIKAERKTLYGDLERLSLFGLDIVKKRDKSVRYYIASRQFELSELKLLVDAVQSSRFITEKNSMELIAKLSSLTSIEQAKQLKRQVYVTGRVKSFNTSTYYSVDAIHAAINDNRKITFKYFDYNIHKKPVYRKNGALYQVTPIRLCWSEDKYYLIAYNAEHGELRNYRVDRMSNVTALEEATDDFDRKKLDINEHIRRMFGMYSGEVVRATLSFDESLVNVVFDYFGKDVTLTGKDNGRFEVTANVSVSPVFLGWMFQFGDRAEVIKPDSLIDAMRALIEENTKMYRK